MFLTIISSIHLYIVTGEMDPSGGSVPTGPNLTGGMEPRMNKHLDRIYEKQIFSYFQKQYLIPLQFLYNCTLMSGPCFKVNVY